MTIWCDLSCDLGLEFARSNIESAISRPKMFRLPRNKKQTYRLLNYMPQIWPSDLTFTVTFTLNFHSQNWNFPISQKKNGLIPTKHKANLLNFQGKVWNLLYLSQIWFDCHKVKKSTDIDWTEGLNDHQVWPWPWPWKVRCKDLPESDRVISDVGVPSTRLVNKIVLSLHSLVLSKMDFSIP